MEQRDQDLVQGYIKGDASALQLLIQRYSARIYRYILSLVRDRDVADMLSQDVFVKMWKHLHTFRMHASFQTWLYVIARHTVFDYFRLKSSHTMNVDFDVLDISADSGGDVIASIDVLIDSERVYEVLNRLTPHEHTVIVLHYFEHMTFREISEIVDAPVNTLKSLHLRALKKIKKFIQ